MEVLTFTVSDEQIAALDKLVSSSQKDHEWHLNQALGRYLREWDLEQIRTGITDADDGQRTDLE